jgi:hypothetical protein
MDELEYLFYVYCYILYMFEAPGVVKKERPALLDNWDADDLEKASDAKTICILTSAKTRDVAPYWGKPCTTLLREFHSVVRDARNKKEDIHATLRVDDEYKLNAYADFAQTLDVYFERTKAAFDEAIAALEQEDPMPKK